MGYKAGYASTGSNVTAFGWSAATNTSTGGAITAIGETALYSNTTGNYNTGLGHQAGYSTTTGSNNTAIGAQALYSSTTSSFNTCVGFYAGYSTTGDQNTFIGKYAGNAVTTGTLNVILGAYNGNQGGLDIRTLSNNIVLSDGGGSVKMYFNSSGYPYINNMRSGNTSTMYFNTTSGEITYAVSSARFKDNIRDTKYGLSDVMKMRSVMFEYKSDGRTDVGVIAEEMEEVIPEIVNKDKDGLPENVGYEKLSAVLVKAIQELKTIVDAQAAEIAELKAKVA